MKKVISGLKDLYDFDIVHRDLKLANIFVQKLNNGMLIPKIGDFGISKFHITN